jgi:hypothetical protein
MPSPLRSKDSRKVSASLPSCSLTRRKQLLRSLPQYVRAKRADAETMKKEDLLRPWYETHIAVI